jgi:hypothetical protein
LHAGWVDNVDLYGDRAIVRVRRKFLAFLDGLLGTIFVDICEGDTGSSSFGEGIRRFKSYPASCL